MRGRCGILVRLLHWPTLFLSTPLLLLLPVYCLLLGFSTCFSISTLPHDIRRSPHATALLLLLWLHRHRHRTLRRSRRSTSILSTTSRHGSSSSSVIIQIGQGSVQFLPDRRKGKRPPDTLLQNPQNGRRSPRRNALSISSPLRPIRLIQQLIRVVDGGFCGFLCLSLGEGRTEYRGSRRRMSCWGSSMGRPLLRRGEGATRSGRIGRRRSLLLAVM